MRKRSHSKRTCPTDCPRDCPSFVSFSIAAIAATTRLDPLVQPPADAEPGDVACPCPEEVAAHAFVRAALDDPPFRGVEERLHRRRSGRRRSVPGREPAERRAFDPDAV